MYAAMTFRASPICFAPLDPMRPFLTMREAAERLRYVGKDRERSVRRAFHRHGIPLIRRDHRNFFCTEQQLSELIEAMQCSLSGGARAGRSGTYAGRSVSVARRASSKNILAERIAA